MFSFPWNKPFIEPSSSELKAYRSTVKTACLTHIFFHVWWRPLVAAVIIDAAKEKIRWTSRKNTKGPHKEEFGDGRSG